MVLRCARFARKSSAITVTRILAARFGPAKRALATTFLAKNMKETSGVFPATVLLNLPKGCIVQAITFLKLRAN